MKLTRFLSLVVIGLMLSFAATGCRTRPQGLTKLPGRNEKPVVNDMSGDMIPPVQPPGGEFTGTPLGDPDKHKGWIENADTFKANTVHFALDSSNVRAGEKAKIAAVADYLKANAAEAVRVEGNCDERGTEEYNRSLGERRSLAVREELILLGIDPSRVDTKSWGEDNAANDHGHGEEAWQQNRRDDFILLSPPK
jgi:peptidoglycan-associated lipoprotein